MVWTKEKDRPMRYLISVGRDKLRAKTLLDMWDICDSEGSTMADEVWDALFNHVERYHMIRDDSGDGRIHMERAEEPEEVVPDVFEEAVGDANIFDDVVANEAYDAQEKVVEEVLDAERRVERRMATSDMFRNTGDGK